MVSISVSLYISQDEPVGTHLDLPGAFFSSHIQCPEGRASQRDLKRQRRLADSGLTANQDQRAFHYASTQDPVDLGVVQGYPVLGPGVYLRKLLRSVPGSGHGIGPGGLPRAGNHLLFHHRIPLSAGRAATHPLGIFIAAVRAEPYRLFLICHTTNVQIKKKPLQKGLKSYVEEITS